MSPNLGTPLAEALDYFTASQAEIIAAENLQRSLMERYKAETKAYFGVEDGQSMNLIQLMAAVSRFGGQK